MVPTQTLQLPHGGPLPVTGSTRRGLPDRWLQLRFRPRYQPGDSAPTAWRVGTQRRVEVG